MSGPVNPLPKSPTSHLHAINLVVALMAGIISIVGGVYTLKSNVFAGPSYGSLEGTVRDEKIAKPLLLASVEVSGIDGVVVNTVETDDKGHYALETLKTGNYVVRFAAPRHIAQTKTVKVEKDLKSSINIDLVPEESRNENSPAVPAVPRRVNPYSSGTLEKPVGAVSNGTPVVSDPATGEAVSQPYGQTSDGTFSGTQPPVRRHPRHRPPYGVPDSKQTGTTQNNDLTQTGIQLLQELLKKKTEQS